MVAVTGPSTARTSAAAPAPQRASQPVPGPGRNASDATTSATRAAPAEVPSVPAARASIPACVDPAQSAPSYVVEAATVAVEPRDRRRAGRVADRRAAVNTTDYSGRRARRPRVGLHAPGGVAEWHRQRSAKPFTRVRFPPPPPSFLSWLFVSAPAFLDGRRSDRARAAQRAIDDGRIAEPVAQLAFEAADRVQVLRRSRVLVRSRR